MALAKLKKRESSDDEAVAPANDDKIGSYFTKPSDKIDFINTGCSLLNCVLGGGWAVGRYANIVGDRSTGKTLLAIEACANFHRQYPNGKIYYAETEKAFDVEYAEAVGLPPGAVDFVADEKPLDTVEHFMKDVEGVLDEADGTEPVLYVLDSVDALSDTAEMARDVDKGSYGAAKPKLLSQFFRKNTRAMGDKRVCLLLISQTRDNIGAMFGEKHTRSGGKALDFYASQIVWLANLGKIEKEKNKVKRPIGVNIRANCKKNKVALPYRTCDFPILFGYGVEDVAASLKWLSGVTGGLDGLEMSKADADKVISSYAQKLTDADYRVLRKKCNRAVRQRWTEIEEDFIPRRRKYA